MRGLVRALCAAGLLTAALPAAGCLQVSGDFDGLAFRPNITRFAVADRHTLLQRNGTLIATQRPDAQKSLTMLFTTAWANPDEEWRRYGRTALNTLRKDLATTDGVLLWDIPLEELVAGAELRRFVNTGEADEPRDFEAAVIVDASVANTATDQGLGSALEMTLTIADADPRAHGYVNGTFELKRSRGPEQEGEVATGAVTLGFGLPVVAERRGEANLAIARPVMECAGGRGPARAGACIDEPAYPVIEETTPITGVE